MGQLLRCCGKIPALDSMLLLTCRPTNGSAAAVPWVETGEAVSAQYAEARAEARQKALLRNACFQQVGLELGG